MPLPPLAWVVLDYCALAGRSVHRLGCAHAPDRARLLLPGATLWRQTAPALCPRCRPRLDLRLSGR